MLFFYSARNAENELVRGTIEAISAQAAREALRDSDLLAEELHEATLHEKKTKSPNLVSMEKEEKRGFPPPPPAPRKEGSEGDAREKDPRPMMKRKKRSYYPFCDTLRLYAGWLLAWYGLVYALGGYQVNRDLPFTIPYVEALLPPFSPIVLTFTLATFLFLLLTSLHGSIGGGKLKGVILTTVGMGIFAWYRLNV